MVYVGEAERQLNERMTEHLRDIKLQRDKPINGHFSKKDHSEEDAVFSILQQIKSGCKTERLMYRNYGLTGRRGVTSKIPAIN